MVRGSGTAAEVELSDTHGTPARTRRDSSPPLDSYLQLRCTYGLCQSCEPASTTMSVGHKTATLMAPFVLTHDADSLFGGNLQVCPCPLLVLRKVSFQRAVGSPTLKNGPKTANACAPHAARPPCTDTNASSHAPTSALKTGAPSAAARGAVAPRAYYCSRRVRPTKDFCSCSHSCSDIRARKHMSRSCSCTRLLNAMP